MKRSICLFIIGVMTTLGCSAKEPFLKQEVQEVSATVEAIDTENRLISLRGPAGTATILAGPDIVNFPQIRVGDQRLTVATSTTTAPAGATILSAATTPPIVITGADRWPVERHGLVILRGQPWSAHPYRAAP